MKPDGKTIVLTGGSSGVGLDILRQLASRCSIINLSRREPERGDLPPGSAFTHIPVDLGDETSVGNAIVTIGRHSPSGIDGLINCAAVQFTPRFIDSAFDAASIATEVAVNMTAPIRLVAGLLPSLLRSPAGFVLNVNSGLGIVPKCESAVYCATKAGLDNFSRGLRAQLRGTNVRVLQVFLPLVDTPMSEGRGEGKLPSELVARRIVAVIERDRDGEIDIGKVGLLRMINRINPALASRIMQGGDG